MRRIGGLFRKIACLTQGAVDFIRRNVLETEVPPRFFVKFAPIGECRLEECRRTSDVRADKLARSVDGAVHMRFCREMEDGIGLEVGESFIHRRRVTDIRL